MEVRTYVQNDYDTERYVIVSGKVLPYVLTKDIWKFQYVYTYSLYSCIYSVGMYIHAYVHTYVHRDVNGWTYC